MHAPSAFRSYRAHTSAPHARRFCSGVHATHVLSHVQRRQGRALPHTPAGPLALGRPAATPEGMTPGRATKCAAPQEARRPTAAGRGQARQQTMSERRARGQLTAWPARSDAPLAASCLAGTGAGHAPLPMTSHSTCPRKPHKNQRRGASITNWGRDLDSRGAACAAADTCWPGHRPPRAAQRPGAPSHMVLVQRPPGHPAAQRGMRSRAAGKRLLGC